MLENAHRASRLELGFKEPMRGRRAVTRRAWHRREQVCCRERARERESEFGSEGRGGHEEGSAPSVTVHPNHLASRPFSARSGCQSIQARPPHVCERPRQTVGDRGATCQVQAQVRVLSQGVSFRVGSLPRVTQVRAPRIVVFFHGILLYTIARRLK